MQDLDINIWAAAAAALNIPPNMLAGQGGSGCFMLRYAVQEYNYVEFRVTANSRC